MPVAEIVTGLSWQTFHSDRMDVVAILIGITIFAILLLMLEGIDRI